MSDKIAASTQLVIPIPPEDPENLEDVGNMVDDLAKQTRYSRPDILVEIVRGYFQFRREARKEGK